MLLTNKFAGHRKTKSAEFSALSCCVSAEKEGFEPPEQLPVHRISSAARSTTPAFFLTCQTLHILRFCVSNDALTEAKVVSFLQKCSLKCEKMLTLSLAYCCNDYADNIFELWLQFDLPKSSHSRPLIRWRDTMARAARYTVTRTV